MKPMESSMVYDILLQFWFDWQKSPPKNGICKCLSFLQMFLQNLEKSWSLPCKKEKLLQKILFKI